MSEQKETGLAPELLRLLDAMDERWDAKFSALKAWGVAALLGGGTLGGIVSSLVAPHATAGVTRTAAGFVVRVFT